MATTLDTFYKNNFTLSSGNLVGTSTAAGGVRASRPVTGLTYFEGVITTLTGTPQIGIADSKWNNLNSLGVTGGGTIGYGPTGIVTNNNVTIATLAAYVQGNRIGVAIDALKKLIWFNINGGNWNNNVANDPVAGVGGIDISTFPLGTIEAAISASITGTVWTMDFSTPFTGTPPTGYASLDAIGFSTARASSTSEVPVGVSLDTPLLKAAVLPTDGNTRGKHFSPAGALTVVSGTTQESGVAVANKKVEVYDRLTGELLGCTYSDGSGNWSIPCLGRPAVRVVGSDPTTFNSAVFDDVVPV